MKVVRLLNDQGREYDSYTDLFRLIRLSGFELVEQDKVDVDAGETYIFPLNNGTAHAIASAPRRPSCRMICWNLERPINGYGDFAPPYFDAVWVSDRWLASELKAFGAHHVRYVPVGGHPGLGGTPQERKVWDFAHMAYLYGRRKAIVDRLAYQGHTIADACWGAERDWRLASSRMGLCLHQDPLGIIEPLRMTLFACWRLPLVAEHSADVFPYKVYGLGEIEQAKADAAGTVEANYRLMTEHLTFRKAVEAAL